MSWLTDCIGASLDCNIIMQLNSRHGIMVTFKIEPSIGRVDATLYICFVNDVMLDRQVGLDCLEVG